MVELIENLYNKISTNNLIFIILIILFCLISCGRKGDLERPPSTDGLEPPEILEDSIIKY
ncbi:MAG: hypothetical protein CFH32_01353 [Alphaproteobacteria bacterium MarineAlpha9_Bin2]|nr:MAG: hypothetical protein CFH32_01353 [Alphaproteobacteria bacterium MarineAlpha9_Bin2]